MSFNVERGDLWADSGIALGKKLSPTNSMSKVSIITQISILSRKKDSPLCKKQ